MVNLAVINKIVELYSDLFAHNGYGEIRVEVRILRRGQKEVIVHCGKQYRFVVDNNARSNQETLDRVKLAIQALEKAVN